MSKKQTKNKDEENVSIEVIKDNEGNQYVNTDDLMSYFKWERKQMMKEYPLIILTTVIVLIVIGVAKYLGLM